MDASTPHRCSRFPTTAFNARSRSSARPSCFHSGRAGPSAASVIHHTLGESGLHRGMCDRDALSVGDLAHRRMTSLENGMAESWRPKPPITSEPGRISGVDPGHGGVDRSVDPRVESPAQERAPAKTVGAVSRPAVSADKRPPQHLRARRRTPGCSSRPLREGSASGHHRPSAAEVHPRWRAVGLPAVGSAGWLTSRRMPIFARVATGVRFRLNPACVAGRGGCGAGPGSGSRRRPAESCRAAAQPRPADGPGR